MTIKQIFLQQVENFINELVTIFPSNGEILIMKEKIGFLKSFNSNLIIENFIEFVYPLKSKIMEQNEDFFLNGGGQEEVIEEDGGINFRNNIRSLWINQMSNENKEIIWKYFKIFVLLIEKYILENITSSTNQTIGR